MDPKALKKEFKAECKAKKTKSYRYSRIGAIVSTVGLIIVLGTLALDFGTQLFPYPLQIVGYAIGAAIAIIGMVLDGIGETTFSKEFKEFLKSKQ